MRVFSNVRHVILSGGQESRSPMPMIALVTLAVLCAIVTRYLGIITDALFGLLGLMLAAGAAGGAWAVRRVMSDHGQLWRPRRPSEPLSGRVVSLADHRAPALAIRPPAARSDAVITGLALKTPRSAPAPLGTMRAAADAAVRKGEAK